MTRAIRLEVDVPGTPEEVWATVATGPGITSWFVPAEVEEREGGAIGMHFGEGMDETATVTAWEPPRRFAYGTGAGTRARARLRVARRAGRGGGHSPRRARQQRLRRGRGVGPRLRRAWRAAGRCSSRTCGSSAPTSPGRPAPRSRSARRCPARRRRPTPPCSRRSARRCPSPATRSRSPASASRGARSGWRRRRPRCWSSSRRPASSSSPPRASGSPAYVSLYGYFFGPEAGAVAEQAAARWKAWLARTFPPSG